MTKTLFMALFAALPVMAQEPAPAGDCCAPGAPCCKPEAPCCAPAKPEGKPCCGKKHHGPRHHQMSEEQKAKFMEKFDTNKDGQIDEQEKEAIKAEFAKHAEERKAKFMEKFDTNKDGQLDEQEKEAAKAEFAKHHQGRPGCHKPHGPHHGPHHGKPGCGKPEGPRPGCNCPCKKADAPAPEAPAAE